MKSVFIISVVLVQAGLAVASGSANECDNWQTLHPEWIFCDDFEDGTPLVREGRYFEYDNDSGDFIPLNGVGFDGSKGMRVIFQAGEVSAGSLHLGFGRNPNGYMNKGIRETEDFRDIYYRMYLKMQPGWVGSPAKLSRATSFSSSTSWAQAMIAHLWSSGNYLLVDPASGVENGVVVTTKYNDFANLHWLGYQAGVTPIFDSLHDGIWYCIEHHIRLNDPGQSNGIQEFWIDGQLEARRAGLNFVDTWTDYAINAIFLENYWNSGSPHLQERYFDNFVVSTQPIGPAGELIAHWTFDEGSGTIAYDSVGNNDGTIYGAQWTTGQIGGALSFDGNGDYVDIADNAALQLPWALTVTAWVKPIYDGRDYYADAIVVKGQNVGWGPYFNYRIAMENQNLYTWGVTRSGTELFFHGGTPIYDNWQHLALTADGTKCRAYINGIEVASRGAPGPYLTFEGYPLQIGGHAVTNARWFSGLIDDVRIYNRALLIGEIQQLYQEGLPQLVGLEIVGPNEVAEDFSAQYKAIAHYDNSNTRDVTDSADWSVEPNDIADIDAGLLETEEIDKPQNIIITAEYTEGQNTQVAEKQVSIFTICPTGTALQFDGQDDYVEVPYDDSMATTNEITIGAWVNITNTAGSGQHYLVDSRDGTGSGYGLNIDTEFIQFWIAGSWYRNFLSTISIKNWHHVVGTYDGSNMIVYVDGAEIDRYSVATNIIPSNSPLFIGQRYGYGERFQGIIDEVAIYNRALTAEEIQILMHTRPESADPNLVGYWDFDEGEGEIAGDSSGNGNDGTLVGAEWAQSDAPIGICTPVAVDIKPGSCPNPLNLSSQGILPVAVLGSQDFDVGAIEAASIRLAGVPAIRNSYEDVASPVSDGNECECTVDGPDGYVDLALKFRTQEVVEELIGRPGELEKDQTLVLTLTGELFDNTGIEGTDCVVLVGNVPKALAARGSDINGDGVVNILDFALMAKYWLESTIY
jgi:hypothetical protein